MGTDRHGFFIRKSGKQEGEFDETVNKAKAMLKAVALAESFAKKPAKAG